MKHYFPDVDTGKLCYDWPPERSAVINTDFQSYAFLSAFCHGYESAVRIGHRLLCEQQLCLLPAKREDIVSLYCQASRVHDLIRRCVRRYKIRHASSVGEEQDLCLRPMSSLPARLKCSVFDAASNRVYWFRTSDFLRMAAAELTRAPDFIVELSPIKNPYTNIPFSSPQLYHLIAQARLSGLRIPIILELYQDLHFNLADLQVIHEPYIRSLAIDCFVRNGTQTEHAEYLMSLVREYHSDAHSLSIHEDFPPGTLVDALGPLLRPYLVTKYGLSPAERFEARRKCRAELATFSRLNPRFGRGILTRPRPEFTLTSSVGNEGVFVFGAAPPESAPSFPTGPLRIDFITRFIRAPRSVTPRSRRYFDVQLPSVRPDEETVAHSSDSDHSGSDESALYPETSTAWASLTQESAQEDEGAGAATADEDSDSGDEAS